MIKPKTANVKPFQGILTAQIIFLPRTKARPKEILPDVRIFDLFVRDTQAFTGVTRGRKPLFARSAVSSDSS